MGSKDKGSRQTRKAPTRDLKQKRADRKAKKDAGNPSRVTSP